MRYSLFNPLFDRRVFMGEPSGGGGGGGGGSSSSDIFVSALSRCFTALRKSAQKYRACKATNHRKGRKTLFKETTEKHMIYLGSLRGKNGRQQ